jgi:hypothetical protein
MERGRGRPEVAQDRASEWRRWLGKKRALTCELGQSAAETGRRAVRLWLLSQTGPAQEGGERRGRARAVSAGKGQQAELGRSVRKEGGGDRAG